MGAYLRWGARVPVRVGAGSDHYKVRRKLGASMTGWALLFLPWCPATIDQPWFAASRSTSGAEYFPEKQASQKGPAWDTASTMPFRER